MGTIVDVGGLALHTERGYIFLMVAESEIISLCTLDNERQQKLATTAFNATISTQSKLL